MACVGARESDGGDGIKPYEVLHKPTEGLQLRDQKLVRSIEQMENTERVVPPPSPVPTLRPFPAYRHSKSGNEVLLVVPTENEFKSELLQDVLNKQAARGRRVHLLIVAVDSNVGEQPYNEAGIEGAHNRIANVCIRLGTGEYDDVLLENRIGTVLWLQLKATSKP